MPMLNGNADSMKTTTVFLREFILKESSIYEYSGEYIHEAIECLNNLPHKIMDYQKLNEIAL